MEKGKYTSKTFDRIFRTYLQLLDKGSLKDKDLEEEFESDGLKIKRFLNTLETFGLIKRETLNEFKIYTVGETIFKLAGLAKKHHPLVSVAHPEIVKLTGETGVSSAIGVINNGSVSYLEVIPTPDVYNLIPSQSDEYEIENTAMGLCLIAWFSKFYFDPKVREILNSDDINERLFEVKNKGYGKIKWKGIYEISVPLKGFSKVICGGLSLFPPDLSPEQEKNLAEKLMKTAEKISEAFNNKNFKENST